VDHALAKGHKVVATSRKPESLPKFKDATDDNYLGVALDVTDKKSIEDAFKKALDKFKQIDVVCNNAGFGLSGVFESLSEKQIRMQMGESLIMSINT
jgi:NADP-dependent 3-hydroxy acid dehydrogenase YdfG